MRKIYKYQIEVTDEQLVTMPAGAQILTVQAQGDRLCLWAVVSLGSPEEKRVIQIYGTGMDFPKHKKCTYIATVQMDGFVWHVFERIVQ